MAAITRSRQTRVLEELPKEPPPIEALVLERKGELSLREIDLPVTVGPHDVKIAIHTVGICGSDVHYYE
jgi:D-arabinose 1-dehydrogenase-like Zn-dependent alcohol dehydrogenase